MPRLAAILLLLLSSGALAQAAPAPAAPAAPAPPRVTETVQRWRSGDGWLTELRRHPDGTTSCVAARSFAERGFGLFLLRTAEVTIFAVVDQAQPFAEPGTIRLAQGARVLGTFDAQAQGPALATYDILSRQVRAAIDRMTTDPLDIEAAGRRFSADMTGVERARRDLDACFALAAKPVR